MSVTFDLQRLRTCTYARAQRVKETRRNMARLEIDADRSMRLQARECLCCFYLVGMRIAGQGFTEWKCMACGAQDVHSNTAVPHYCDKCADEMRICVRCGADQELAERKAVKAPKKARPGA